jgi:hypothetical protein
MPSMLNCGKSGHRRRQWRMRVTGISRCARGQVAAEQFGSRPGGVGLVCEVPRGTQVDQLISQPGQGPYQAEHGLELTLVAAAVGCS